MKKTTSTNNHKKYDSAVKKNQTKKTFLTTTNFKNDVQKEQVRERESGSVVQNPSILYKTKNNTKPTTNQSSKKNTVYYKDKPSRNVVRNSSQTKTNLQELNKSAHHSR